MKKPIVHLFARQPDSDEIEAICLALADFKVQLHTYQHVKQSLQEGEIILLPIQNTFEEIIRISAELRTRNPESQFILIGERIPPLVSFHCKAAMVLRLEELSLLKDVYAELLHGNSNAANFAAMHELQSKNKELEKINFELDRFVYSASHDLRSPLTSVLGLLYLLRNETNAAETIRYVDLMEESILKLDNIIRDIVAYSRNNRTQVNIEKVEIKDVVKDISAGLRYLESDEIVLKEIISIEEPAVIQSDRTRIQIILNNLISNSIKYKHPNRKPKISISCKRTENNAIVSVKDNGIGIKEEHLGKIFDMFYRTSDKSSGSGLGLYIVKETIKKLGGTVDVCSEINSGTTFTLTIPITEDALNY
ncbi:MAG: sensor histidine kinase [Bacteroidia bacterium]|jgi:signal transduction histidine kinase